MEAHVMVEPHVLGGDERVRHEARQRRERHRRRDAPVDAVERPDALRRAARTGQKNGRRAPGVAHQLARETPFEDEKIDRRGDRCDPDQRRDRDHPSRQTKEGGYKKPPAKKPAYKKPAYKKPPAKKAKSVISRAVETIRDTASSIGSSVTSYLPSGGGSTSGEGGPDVATTGGKSQ